MLRFRGTALVIVCTVIGLLAGCGGGGGGGGTGGGPGGGPGGGGGPAPSTDVTVTGRIVSSLDPTKGVAGITLTFGGAYATTDSTGAYKLTFSPTVAELPFFFAVDTSGAGSAFPTTELVSLANGQTYDHTEVDMPVGILNGGTTTMPTIVVRQVNSEVPPAPPYPSHNGLVYGRLVKSDGTGIASATIRLGNPSAPALTVTTGARGYFAFDLGNDAQLVDVVGTDRTFSVDLSTATGFTESTMITYGTGTDAFFQRQAIPIPSDSDTIGLVIVNTSSSGTNPVNPPAPPGFF